MLASTVKFSRYGRAQTHQPPTKGRRQTLVRKKAPQTRPTLQDPTACSRQPPTIHAFHSPKKERSTHTNNQQKPQVNVPHSGASPSREQTPRNQTMNNQTKMPGCQKLLRKEVIQPHLPVRLPCYDLVLITSPTFDGSLQKVGPPASGVTDFHDLTGGVYKPRERIHRSVADLRLLATPTS